MFSELERLLAPLTYKIYDTDVHESSPKLPYIVLWGGNARPHEERPLTGRMVGVHDRLGVTTAAGTVAGARILHQRVRHILQPNGFPIIVAGFTLTLDDHQPPQVDRDEVIASTGRHPAFAVDIFRVTR